ncbi:MAG: glucosidase, partial [Acidobacteria bacterium]
YAKLTQEDILIRIEVCNRGAETAQLHLLPTIWFRNTWCWGLDAREPHLRSKTRTEYSNVVILNHYYYDRRYLYSEGAPEMLFTENETNFKRLWGVENIAPYVKDGINDYIVSSALDAVNPKKTGSKASAHYNLTIPPFSSVSVRLRFSDQDMSETKAFDDSFDQTFSTRIQEADNFYDQVIPEFLSDDAKKVMRQSFAGMLWSKEFYYYEISRWLAGDPLMPKPPAERHKGRNNQWTHLYNADVISMPDKWEYPWYAAWDLAFHCIPLALVDSDFAKEQLVLLLREWYMHPNGQLPAYEWAFGDVNPPVHAWAAWRIYKIDKKRAGGVGDRRFLERVFHKLLLNFTWWINRKDTEGRNVFQGGFLGLDNIGVFDRSAPLPTGGHIEQSDATSWMGMYCLNMLAIAMELASEDPVYEDVASKFFEHFVYICRAMHDIAGSELELWDPLDGFYYDVLCMPGGNQFSMRIRSMVGLIPLFAVETLDSDVVDKLPGFKRRMQWFIENRTELSEYIETETTADGHVRRFLSLVNRDRLKRVLRYMLDESEFLSSYGIRALSAVHKDHPYIVHVGQNEYRVDYEPAESRTGLFGGNSNWRGPIWFPVNFLIIESLQKFHFYLGDEYKVECPTRSGEMKSLWEVAADISRRLTHIFLHDADGRRPVFGNNSKFQTDPYWRDFILFYEYFHGDTGAGLGASHQTGWTGLVAKLMQQSGE